MDGASRAIAIEERLDRLERENERLARWASWLMRLAVVSLVGMALSLGGQVFPLHLVDAQQRELSAERLIIRDSSGAVRAYLGVDDSGVGFSLIGARGALEPGSSAGSITMMADGRQTHLRASNGMDGDSPSVFLGSQVRGSGFLGVVDGSGNTAFQAP